LIERLGQDAMLATCQGNTDQMPDA
jgi:hypothetical protein